MGPPGVYLAANLVICAALEVVSTTSAPPPLDLPLSEDSDSCPASGPPLLPDCTRWIGNFRTGLLSIVLKGLRRIVTLSSSLMKVGMGVCMNKGIGWDNVVGSGVETSGGISNFCICFALPSSDCVCISSIQAGWRGDNFGLWKFKMEMVLAAKDLWNIVDKSKSPPPNDAEESTKNEYTRRCKKALAIITMNLVDKEMLHIKGCTGPAEAWETLCNIHETKSLSKILFLRCKFFTIKMEEGTDILEHINKVKSLVDQLLVLEVPLRGEDVVMTLLDSLPPSFDYVITALETRPFKELTMEFVTARLVHEESKKKEKEPHGNDSAMVSRQGKGITSNSKNEPRLYFICGKSGHIACHFWQKNDNVKNNANNAKVEDVKEDHLFVVGDGA